MERVNGWAETDAERRGGSGTGESQANSLEPSLFLTDRNARTSNQELSECYVIIMLLENVQMDFIGINAGYPFRGLT